MPSQYARALPPASVADFEPVADALIDKLILTCDLTFSHPGVGGADGLRSRLVDAGILQAGRRREAKVSFSWMCPSSHEVLRLDGRLAIADGPRGVVRAAGSSYLDISPLRLLRDQVNPVCGVGLDGRKNVVGPPEEDRPNLLGLQLDTVSGMIDAFVQSCSSASGSPVSIGLWVRAVELNRDLPRPDAVELAHRLSGELNPWYRMGWARHYPARPDHAHDGNYVTVTWRNDREDAPIRMKFYAKTAGLMRTEVCLDNRRAVQELVRLAKIAWPTGPATDGGGVADSLATLARAAVPVLDAMSAHVARLGAPQRGLLDLMVALAPLMRAAAPPPPHRAGGRPGERTQADVRNVLYHLLAVGRFDASGLKTNSTVRKALSRIAAEGGLIAESRGRAPLFTVPPNFAGARAAALRALLPDRDADGGPRRLASR